MRNWRHRTKQRIIDSFGGKCIECGYSRCNAALELHHLNPDEKEHSISDLTSCPRSWEKVVFELRKCALLCSNCHREVHNGIRILAHGSSFNEEYVTYREYKSRTCDICGGKTAYGCNTCSAGCAGIKRQKVDWQQIDLRKMIKEDKLTYEEIGRQLECTGAAVKRQWLKVK